MGPAAYDVSPTPAWSATTSSRARRGRRLARRSGDPHQRRRRPRGAGGAPIAWLAAVSVVPGKYCRRVLVVQGAWVGGRLALWGEGGAPLTGVVDGRLDELTVLLPTAGGRPVPSPEAAGDGPPDVDDLPPDAPVLAPWPVAAARLEPRDALAWLGDLPDPDALDDAGWVAGASLRYLAVLAGYAAGLARRGRMLPQLVDGPAARWRPVLTGRDAAAFRDFAAAMPPVCRAAGGRPVRRRRRARRARRRWSTRPRAAGDARAAAARPPARARRRRCPTAGRSR